MQEETYMMQEEEVVAGKHSVTEALKSGRTINKIWIAENAQKHLTLPIIAEAKLGIVIQHVDKRKLDQMVPGVQHQGVVAQAAPYAYVEVDDLLKAAEEKASRLSCCFWTRSRIRTIWDRFSERPTARALTVSYCLSADPRR